MLSAEHQALLLVLAKLSPRQAEILVPRHDDLSETGITGRNGLSRDAVTNRALIA